jgi:hypothetical protein
MLRNKANNRRRGPDTLTKVIGIFAGISWLLVIFVFILYINSKPREVGIRDRLFSVTSSNKGDPSLLLYANIVLVLVIIVCFTGVMINMSRHKRKNDRFSKSLIFFGIGSIVLLVYNLLFN